jgi:ABC-type transport system involved in multi-copper enzyme maturation permease subunit
MVGAELLKLRRRSLIAWTGALTLGSSIGFAAVNTVRHHLDPVHYGPAGGVTNLTHAMQILAYLGTVAAVLLGTTAGGQDRASGVFRDLATTGRPRLTLFMVRLPAALSIYLFWFLPAYAVAAGTSVALSGPLPAPSAAMLLQDGLGVGLSTVLDVILAVGLAAALGSRSIAIGVLLGWELAISRLLEHMTSFGAARQLLPSSAIDRILPDMGQPRTVPMAMLTAAFVLLGWAAAMTVVGAWKTAVTDA